MIKYIMATFFDKKIMERKDKVLTFVGENRHVLSLKDRAKSSNDLSSTALSEYFEKVVGLNTKERLDYNNLF